MNRCFYEKHDECHGYKDACMSLSNKKTILPLQHNPALFVSDWSVTFKQTSKVKEGTGELKSHLNTSIEEPMVRNQRLIKFHLKLCDYT